MPEAYKNICLVETQEAYQICREYLDNPLALKIYHVWYKYLKLNSKYKSFCTWLEKNKKDLLYNESKHGKTEYFLGQFLIPIDQWKFSTTFPDELKNSDINNLWEVFRYWQNIYTDPWEKVMDRICFRMGHNNDDFPPLIYEYSPIEQIDHYTKFYQKHYERDPSIEEIKDLFLTFKRDFSQDELYLRVNVNSDVDKLKDNFLEIVSKRNKKIIKKEKPLPFPKPSKKLTDKDLRYLLRYLKVYRLKEIREIEITNLPFYAKSSPPVLLILHSEPKSMSSYAAPPFLQYENIINGKLVFSKSLKGLTWLEIIEKIDPDGKIHKVGDISDPKVWRSERDNAETIIENTGNNIFPGPYGESLRRKNNRTTSKKHR